MGGWPHDGGCDGGLAFVEFHVVDEWLMWYRYPFWLELGVFVMDSYFMCEECYCTFSWPRSWIEI